MRSLVCSIGAALGALLVLSPRPSRAEAPGDQQAVATTLFETGRALMEAGNYEEACPRLEESQRLDPGGGTLMNLAHCRNLQGRTRTAYLLFTEALSVARRDKRDDRIAICQENLESLKARLPTIAIVVRPDGRPRGLVVKLNGVVVPEIAWGSELPLDPGDAVVSAEAPGFVSAVSHTQVKDGEHGTLEVPSLLEAPAASRPSVRADRVDPPRPSGPDRASSDKGETSGRALAMVRVDVDGRFRGAVTHVGLGVGITRFAEASFGALLGATSGFELGARGFVPLGVLRPFVTLGMPCFVDAGAIVGVRGGAGLEWSIARHVAVFAQIAGAYFPSGSGSRAYEQAAFLPALGIVGRL